MCMFSSFIETTSFNIRLMKEEEVVFSFTWIICWQFDQSDINYQWTFDIGHLFSKYIFI